MAVELAPRAQRDLRGISAFGVERFGEGQAARYADGLDALFDLLDDNPEMGIRYGERLRRITYKSHHVYYRIDREKIVIVTVRGARMRPL